MHFQPILAGEIFRLDLSCQIGLHFAVDINVVEARFVFAVELPVIPYDHSRGLYQPRFNRIIQAEVADDPSE